MRQIEQKCKVTWVPAYWMTCHALHHLPPTSTFHPHLHLPPPPPPSTTTPTPHSMSDPVRVNRGSLTDLKNAVDDHLKKFLTTNQGYTENHLHIDIKLFLGYLSCLFAAIGSWYGYVHSFDDSRTITAVCVGAYFFLNVILFLYTTFVEKDTVFVGVKRDPVSKLTFASERPASSKASPSKYLLESSFGEWFDEDGVLHEPELERDLKDALEKSGTKVHVE
ncbi:microsomal signal peptidase 25 kDa subunit-domain-containing protein [Jimgerdemannia flammicorona]|uniref:Signal peptidase complex subunit 2 n=1 Tax=Jimgerdemannia flammicorona TaxID=994334 RepID=A0A433QPK5_9FUNG|nr:microsomal signal peptidase 25 kDa subunit-domain-containing protein [Jimgerdemannia flammicorona]